VKAVLLSVQPKWCDKICNAIGHDENFTLIYEKTVEVRKTRPKLSTPFKVYIYCTKGEPVLKTIGNSIFIDKTYKDGDNLYGLYEHVNGKVIGEFVCDCITGLKADNMLQAYYNNTKETCLTDEEIKRYANGGKLYYWHISNLVIYDKPRELRGFKKINRECWYADLGLAKRDCPECKNEGCFVTRPPQSWCYVEGGEANAN
jgi:predicted transcriptional regulator